MSRVRSWATFVATVLFVLAGGNFAAIAVTGPTVTIANTGNALVGSSVANFDPSETLRLELSASAGTVTVDLGTSGAVQAPGAALTGAKVAITGTQAQLNAALATTTLSDSCTATRSITAYVVEGVNSMYLDADNSHWYAEVVTAGDSWDTDKTNADAMTLPHSTGHGYLATITSASENTFLNNHFSDTPMFGASDAALEGDWYWMDGPEAGTKFYTNGAPVVGQYTNFNTGEPNNLNVESYGQLWSGDTWNDIAGDNRYLVEFGGLAGDNFAGVLSATATSSLTVSPVLTGAGTSASPFLIATASDLSHVAQCAAAGVYFKQTDDITVDSGFQTGGNFSGFYDGNGKKIDLNALGSLSRGLFGTVSGTNAPADTKISNLTVDESTLQTMSCIAGGFSQEITNATIDNVTFLGGSTTVDCEGGMFAMQIRNSVIENTSVSGNLSAEFMLFRGGGLAGNASNSTFSNVTCDVDFVNNENHPMFDLEMFGGCVGDSSQNTFHRVSFTGNLDFTSNNLGMAMAMAIGGIAGNSYQDKFEQDFATGVIKTDFSDSLGLFAGMMNTSTVTEGVSAGQIVAGDGQNVGGIAGYSTASSISDSYSSSRVSGAGNVGAFIGNMQNGSSLTTSYSSGLVTSSSNATHVLVGASSSANITSSYWKVIDGGALPTIESLGQEVPKYSGDLKKISTFDDWNISASPSSANVWAICPGANGGYPYPAWQDLPGGCVRSFTSGASATVSGLAYVGNTVTSHAVGWDPLATISYQWYAGTTPIAGSTGATLAIGPAYKGVQLWVKITGAKDGYNTMTVSSAAAKVADVPGTAVLSIGGFKAKSKVISAKSVQAVKKLVANAGTLLTVKCEGFATGKKLTPAERALAKSRAAAVCALVTTGVNGLTGTLGTSIAKKSDKLPEGVRITISAIKP